MCGALSVGLVARGEGAEVAIPWPDFNLARSQNVNLHRFLFIIKRKRTRNTFNNKRFCEVNATSDSSYIQIDL